MLKYPPHHLRYSCSSYCFSGCTAVAAGDACALARQACHPTHDMGAIQGPYGSWGGASTHSSLVAFVSFGIVALCFVAKEHGHSSSSGITSINPKSYSDSAKSSLDLLDTRQDNSQAQATSTAYCGSSGPGMEPGSTGRSVQPRRYWMPSAISCHTMPSVKV